MDFHTGAHAKTLLSGNKAENKNEALLKTALLMGETDGPDDFADCKVHTPAVSSSAVVGGDPRFSMRRSQDQAMGVLIEARKRALMAAKGGGCGSCVWSDHIEKALTTVPCASIPCSPFAEIGLMGESCAGEADSETGAVGTVPQSLPAEVGLMDWLEFDDKVDRLNSYDTTIDTMTSTSMAKEDSCEDKASSVSHEASQRFSTPRLTEIRSVFFRYRRGDDGVIATEDLGSVLCALGHRLPDAQLSLVVGEASAEGGGMVGFHRFLELVARLEHGGGHLVGGQLPEARAAEIRTVFSHFKQGAKETIAIADLGQVARALGHALTEAELRDIAREAVHDTLDFDEYWLLAARLDDRGALALPSGPRLPSVRIAELRELFAKYDRAGDDTIATEDLGAVIFSLGHFLTPWELEEIVQEADEDGSGSLDFEEFLALVLRLEELTKPAKAQQQDMSKLEVQQPLVAWLNSAEFDPGPHDSRLLMEEPGSGSMHFDQPSSRPMPKQEKVTMHQAEPGSRLAACRRDLRAIMRNIDSRLPSHPAKKGGKKTR